MAVVSIHVGGTVHQVIPPCFATCVTSLNKLNLLVLPCCFMHACAGLYSQVLLMLSFAARTARQSAPWAAGLLNGCLCSSGVPAPRGSRGGGIQAPGGGDHWHQVQR